jgi:hypothetical protein
MARLEILQAHHDFPSAGHFGYNKTLELVSRDYWWPQMWNLLKIMSGLVIFVSVLNVYATGHMDF